LLLGVLEELPLGHPVKDVAMGKLVDIDTTSLEAHRIGALPVVNRFFARIGLESLLCEYVPADPRATLAYADVLLVLLQSPIVCRTPVYKIGEWIAGREAGLLGLKEEELCVLNDDRVGRALEALFRADRASMLTKLMCQAISAFSLSLDELHNDATTLSMQGAYGSSAGDSPRAPRVRFGHTKERPDLAQLVWLLTISSDGNVPITYRLADGNTPEDPTHIETWNSCCVLVGCTTFLYVSDAKLCNRDAMGHIDRHHGCFLAIMPNTRSEVGEFRRFIAASTSVWTEVLHRPGKRIDDPEEVFCATPAPSPSSEGYRIVWIHSSEKVRFDIYTTPPGPLPRDARRTVIVARDDRTLRPGWLRHAARDRLDADVVEVPGGYCPHVSRPKLRPLR